VWCYRAIETVARERHFPKFPIDVTVCVAECLQVCVANPVSFDGGLCRVAATGWRTRMAFFIFIGHFPPKSPVISCLVAGNDLEHKASYDSSPRFILSNAHTMIAKRIAAHVAVHVAVCVVVYMFLRRVTSKLSNAHELIT